MHRPWRKNILAKITEWSNCCEVKWCFGSVLGLDSKHNDYKAKKGSAGDIFSIKVPFDTSTPQIWVYPHIRGGNKHFALLIAVLSNLFHRWSKTSKLCHRSVFLRENVHPFSSFSSGRAVSSPITARTHIYTKTNNSTSSLWVKRLSGHGEWKLCFILSSRSKVSSTS